MPQSLEVQQPPRQCLQIKLNCEDELGKLVETVIKRKKTVLKRRKKLCWREEKNNYIMFKKGGRHKLQAHYKKNSCRIIKTKSFRDLILRLIPFGNHETKMNVSERGKRALFWLYFSLIGSFDKMCGSFYFYHDRKGQVSGNGKRNRHFFEGKFSNPGWRQPWRTLLGGALAY